MSGLNEYIISLKCGGTLNYFDARIDEFFKQIKRDGFGCCCCKTSTCISNYEWRPLNLLQNGRLCAKREHLLASQSHRNIHLEHKRECYHEWINMRLSIKHIAIMRYGYFHHRQHVYTRICLSPDFYALIHTFLDPNGNKLESGHYLVHIRFRVQGWYDNGYLHVFWACTRGHGETPPITCDM